MKTPIFAFVLSVLLFACSHRLSIRKYIEYKKEHSEIFSLEDGNDPRFDLSIVTPEQIVIDNSTEIEANELKKEYEQMRNQELTLFNLQISRENGFLNENYGNRKEQTEFYSMHFKKNIVALTTTNDTVPCSGYLFQAGSSIGNNGFFEFQFNKKIKDIKEVLIRSPYLGDTVYRLSLSTFHNNYPSLKIK